MSDCTCCAQTALRKAGVKMFGSTDGALGLPACPSERHEYGTNELTLEVVSSMDEAITHIHQHGSSHTECIVTGALLLLLPVSGLSSSSLHRHPSV